MRCMCLFFITYRVQRIKSQHFSSHALQIICHTATQTLDDFGLCKAAAALSIDPEVRMFGVWRLGLIGLNMYVCQFLGAEMWCQLGMQILLVSTTVLVVGKPAMVQLIAGLIEISSLGRCSVQTTLDMVS